MNLANTGFDIALVWYYTIKLFGESTWLTGVILSSDPASAVLGDYDGVKRSMWREWFWDVKPPQTNIYAWFSVHYWWALPLACRCDSYRCKPRLLRTCDDGTKHSRSIVSRAPDWAPGLIRSWYLLLLKYSTRGVLPALLAARGSEPLL